MGDFSELFSSSSVTAALAIMLKMGVAVILAGAIGWERERAGRPAGIRTHMMVAMGVVLICEVSKTFGGDPSRIAAGIVTGIGFLGAGTIMRMGVEIKGLTTAASVWATAGISMATSVGHHMIVVATLATILAICTLSVVDHLERRLFPMIQYPELRVGISDASDLPALMQALADLGASVSEARVDARREGSEVTLRIAKRDPLAISTAMGCPGVTSAAWID